MNLFELMTLNNYGRTKEVLFTSSLSYLLNPLCDHGLGDIFLKKFLEQLSITITEKTNVSSEKSFGIGVGNIDIFIESETHIIGIEAKIWDDSAINNSKNNEAQLKRYCEALKKLSEKEKKKKKWILVFLIPYKDAPICIEEFEKIKPLFNENIRLLTWNYSEENSTKHSYLEQSISDIIESIINDSTIDIVDRTQWILKSMYNYIPNFIKQEKSKSRFPSRKDLEENCPDLMNNLINPFCEILSVRINPIHTTIGFPYGIPPEKSEYGNTLFRIRTTKKYYDSIEQKKENYPDALEIEIWEEVYNKIKNDNDWKKWLSNVTHKQLCESVHIDEKKKEKIILLRIEKGTIKKEQVEKFNEIMKKGFEKTINQN